MQLKLSHYWPQSNHLLFRRTPVPCLQWSRDTAVRELQGSSPQAYVRLHFMTACRRASESATQFGASLKTGSPRKSTALPGQKVCSMQDSRAAAVPQALTDASRPSQPGGPGVLNKGAVARSSEGNRLISETTPWLLDSLTPCST